MRSHRQANKGGSIEPSTQWDIVWKTLRGKPHKTPDSWEIRPKYQKWKSTEICIESQEGQSTGALVPFEGLIDQTSWYKRLGKFISLKALTAIIDITLERLSLRGREDMEEVEKKLPLNMGYKKITSWKTCKCTSENLKNWTWSKHNESLCHHNHHQQLSSK